VPKNNKFPPHIIDHWPEVFDDVEIKAVPIDYITAVNVHFHDGKVWQINLDETAKKTESPLEEVLEAFFTEYDEQIESIDFELNTRKVKKDIRERTRKFMKKRK
jgi:hypothetical protein